jgi:hypothetical protein
MPLLSMKKSGGDADGADEFDFFRDDVGAPPKQTLQYNAPN